MAEINRTSGTHFDPALVAIFNKVLPELLEIKARYAMVATASPQRNLQKRSNGVRKRSLAPRPR